MEPDNKEMQILVPLQLHSRALHQANPQKGGVRPPYGGTKSLGFKRGSWVKHPQYGTCYAARTEACQFLCYTR